MQEIVSSFIRYYMYVDTVDKLNNNCPKIVNTKLKFGDKI